MSGKKIRRGPVITAVLLFIVIGIPVIAAGLSFFGRITPDSVIPDRYELFVSVPEPVRFAGRVLDHKSLPDIMALAEMAPLLALLDEIKATRVTENRLVRFAARGQLDGALLGEGRMLVSWDAGVLSPLLKILPLLAGRISVPGLYYVQAGKNSRFEFRLSGGQVYFIGPYKNLLIISNNSALYESVIAGTSRTGDRYGSDVKKINPGDHDIAFLLSPEFLMKIIGGAEQPGDLRAALELLSFPGPVEARLSVLPDQLKLKLASPLLAGNEALQKIIETNSRGTSLAAMIPGSAQYLTLLAAGSLGELWNGASAIAAGSSAGADFGEALTKADSTARMTLGMNMEELLFSWMGTEFAVFGLEGRQNPVLALEIRDELKRREVFSRAFRSAFLDENIQLNLDGNRVPRIQLPPFLSSLLGLLELNIPSPYYTVQDNYLFVSESAEALLASVNAVRRNDVLPGTELWRTLSKDNSGPSSFSLFYSLDRSLPFFLKGGGEVITVLKLYRQGLVHLCLENRLLTLSLNVIPGAGKGLVPVMGYPIDLSGSVPGIKTGNRLYKISSGKDTRLLAARGSSALSINPIDRSIKEMTLPGSPGAGLHVIPAAPENAAGGAAWVVNSQGQVSLVNRDMENMKGFPLSTGIKLSTAPGAWGGKLFLSGEDGSLHTVDSAASVSGWGKGFASALRSPPAFMDFKNRTYSAVYPKSLIFGEIFLLDGEGAPLPGWPAAVSGIAFGSPLIFSARYNRAERLLVAFITQAGELSVYTENAEILPGFPLALNGVFYLQPVFDGESLWLIEAGGTLYRVELDGAVLSQKIPRLCVREEGCLIAANGTGGQKNPEVTIFITGEGNALHGYSRNFSSLDDFPLPVWGRPVFGDLNGDGKTEAAGVGMDNKLYLWQFR